MQSTHNDLHNLAEPILESIRRALAEDIGPGDATTDSIVPAEASLAARIVAKQVGTVAGLDVAAATFNLLDDSVHFMALVPEGARVKAGEMLATLEGPARAILTASSLGLSRFSLAQSWRFLYSPSMT